MSLLRRPRRASPTPAPVPAAPLGAHACTGLDCEDCWQAMSPAGSALPYNGPRDPRESFAGEIIAVQPGLRWGW